MRASPRLSPLFPAFCLALLLAGCGVNGDFGEVNPSLVRDDIHDWVGRDDAKGRPISPSSFELTDDERQLRDLGYPLLEPPYNRQKAHSVLSEYGMTPWILKQSANPAAYYDHMMERGVFSQNVRSPSSRYAVLIDDIRNDSERLPQFFATAGRVVDMDIKRKKSLAFIRSLTQAERTNTLNRIRENDRVIMLVRTSLERRVASYRYALERLVISSPSNDAVTAEQMLNQLATQVGYFQNRTAPTYQRGPSLAYQR
ncbi:MAG: hypothetical protein JSR61_16090 [Proteobacteria bacterium]|nr:hypothetical protein [Pseudomonadota bacterium]